MRFFKRPIKLKCILAILKQDTQEFLRCFMDQLHEELKQVVITDVHDDQSSDNSDQSLHDPPPTMADRWEWGLS